MAKKEILVSEVKDKLSDILDLLTDSERTELLEHAKVQTLSKNAYAYRDGDQPHDLICVVSGKLKICKDGVSGRSQLIRVLKPTSYSGYRAYFSGVSYSSSAAALEPTVIVRIPLILLTRIIQQNASLAWFFIQELSQRLGSANERTVNLTQKHVRGRLAEALIFLRDTYGLEEDGCTLSIYLSREDMANMSNMTTSNAIRTLSAFAQEKLIAIDGRKIKLMDMAALETVSKFG
ncbi:MAG: Crp/Fnr family transcriptional regulator [Bacteroidales bacterium]|nr:Crp/Fnr family transcriptional regulator [Candidatus Physcousia equi]